MPLNSWSCSGGEGLIQYFDAEGCQAVMGEPRVAQETLFYEFSRDRHVPADDLLRAIDRFVDLSSMREHLRGFYNAIGWPSNCHSHRKQRTLPMRRPIKQRAAGPRHMQMRRE